jgi:hypothetical protein
MTNETNVEQIKDINIKRCNSFSEYIAHELADYIHMRDGWQYGTPQWHTYDLLVRELTKIESAHNYYAALSRQRDETAQGDWKEQLNQNVLRHPWGNEYWYEEKSLLEYLTSRTAEQKAMSQEEVDRFLNHADEMNEELQSRITALEAQIKAVSKNADFWEQSATKQEKELLHLQSQKLELEAENKRLREGWVSVEDRLPTADDAYPKYNEVLTIQVGRRRPTMMKWWELKHCPFTKLWMKVPTPPAQTDNDKTPPHEQQ